jgi:hypothetical protein
MPPHDAGKERSNRTRLDCHKLDDSLSRWKERLGVVALLVSLAGPATSFWLSDQGDFHASRGPVASVHQIWDTQCSACHVPFTPISSHSWAAPFLGDAQASSQRCQACHDGPVHHAGQQPDLACGSCHREHRGRDASLVNLPDRDCTQCHRDLSKHHSGEVEFRNVVSGFSIEHPEFRSVKTDPGKLKFNHLRHLTAGMALKQGGKVGGEIHTLGKIAEPFRKRYRDQQEKKEDSAPVQLQCASCHQLDGGDFGVTSTKPNEFPFSLMGGRNAGAYMLPISYENQCQACHPLTIERKVADDPKPGYLTIPHRLSPQDIHELLKAFFTAQIARGQAGFLEKKATRPLPGKMPGLLEPTVRAWIDQNVAHAEKDLYLSKRLCAECHYFEGKSIAEAFKTSLGPELRVAPPQVPPVWFRHAKFNHTAHRAVQCAHCHAKAENSTLHTDVLIPDRDTCVQCHAPKAKAGTLGARHNCTECHRYHNGEHPTQGIGAAKRRPKKLRDIDDFLSVK